MRLFRPILAVTLLALWVPMTAHCTIESLPGMEFLSCHFDETEAPLPDGDCQTDACRAR